MDSKLCDIVESLRETREQVFFLKDQLGISLGDIQVGYEYAIESILEMIGLSEREIDIFWNLSDPTYFSRKSD